MFLKSIEVKGFKSFADKTVLDFKNGVTAVVGPNGSGKSNISDAVKWVLGEQSVKSLRGNKMEDVIFSGTQYRKPVSLAYVCLSLDNSDGELPINYSQVNISRRLYRSGDSEYYINNTQCRLKDIQELFMDTGIGKEGYSIIGQGKIDKILSGKSEDRRSLLEEAAGIVKYKTRKQEAERKLQSMDANLIRINDILSTYQDRIEPLRIESEKAERFLELSDGLKQKEINLILDSLDKNNNKINDVDSKELELSQNLDSLKAQQESLEAEVASLNQGLDKIEEIDKENKKSYYENKNALGELQGESNLIKDKIENNKQYIGKAGLELNVYNDKHSLYRDTYNNLIKELNFKKEEQQQLDKNISELSNKGKETIEYINSLKQEIESLKEEDIDLLSLISQVKNNALMLKNNTGILKNRLTELLSFKENYKASLQFNKIEKSKCQQQINKINEKIENLKKINNDLISDKNNKTEELSAEDKKLKEIYADKNKAWAKENTLKNLENSYEGYNRSVKVLMSKIENGDLREYRGKCCLLGEIVTADKNLETAMEVALSAAISNIITDEESIAKSLINYLKKNNLGRATFLPLNIIKGKAINENLNLSSDGFIGIASDLIKYPSKYKNAIDFILGRVLIAKDMDSALIIGKKTSYRYKIVTLSGDVVNAGGSLTGGSTSFAASGIIGRKREISELQERIESLKNEEINQEKLIIRVKDDINKIEASIENNKNKINGEVIEITKISGKIASIDQDSSKINSNMELSDKEIQTIKESLKESSEEIQNKEESIDNLTNKEKSLLEALDEKENNLKVKEEESKSLLESLTDLKVDKASKDQYILSKDQEALRILKETDDIKKKIEENSKDINDKQDKIKALNESLVSLDKEMNDKKEEISKMEDVFIKSETSIITLKKDIESKSSNLKEINIEKARIESDLHKFEITKTKLQTELTGLYDDLNQLHNLTYAEALEYKTDGIVVSKLKEEIKDLKAQVSLLGVINVGSIEEYKEVSEKFKFMSSQREDIIKSREEILQVISEMTKKMRSIFNENFQKLRVNFNETFKELFKGGSADLILSDSDELTSDIEINVQPPGKKLGSINLLSGGEKVLSAIALLFAILKMKPTPFCILDEIEAALDDANVARYADFLKKFSSNIQFIVITHRKGTMEVSDILYGVTMEEKGVSKIVSVKLAEK